MHKLLIIAIAIVDDVRFRRRDKMFSAKYLPNDSTFSKKFFTGFFWAMRRRIEENLVGVNSRAGELTPKMSTHF